MRRTLFLASLPLSLLCGATPIAGRAQSAAAGTAAAQPTTGVPRQSGTIKAVTPQDFVLTNAAGQDFAVNMPSSARILLVDPVSRDLKSARQGTIADIAGGDKAIVSGTQGDTGQTLTATRVLLLKSGAIAAMHASEEAAWAHSVGGVVRSVDRGTGSLTVANGQRTSSISTTPSTQVRRYAAGSVRFEDAVQSTVAAIQPGDQVQVRGQRSGDGTSVTADEIVTGSFSNFSGTLTDVDASAGTLTLRDLASKKTVTVAVSPQSNLRKLPPGFGQGQAASPPSAAAAVPAGTTAGASSTAPAAARGGARGGRLDLSRAVNRFPTETLADLAAGEAVMIVASNASGEGQPTAITVLSGVGALLSSSAAGQTTLAPWSLGSSEAEGSGESGGGGTGPGH